MHYAVTNPIAKQQNAKLDLILQKIMLNAEVFKVHFLQYLCSAATVWLRLHWSLTHFTPINHPDLNILTFWLIILGIVFFIEHWHWP